MSSSLRGPDHNVIMATAGSAATRGRQPGPGRALENIANNLAPVLDPRRDRWDARSVLWHESNLKRVRSCGRWAITSDGSVGVRKRADAVGYAGLATCGSVWACPVCNNRIQNVRRLEVESVLEVAGSAAFGAYTIRHRRGQDLDLLWRALSDCWAGVARDKTVKRLRVEMGHLGIIRAAEVTHGSAGWHPHLHPIHVFEGTVDAAAVATLHAAQFRAWAAAADRLGLSTPVEDAQHLHLVSGAADAALSEYLTKTTYAASARSVSWEMTSTQTKSTGRAKSSRTPWEVLRSVHTTGDADDLDLWHDWERASKGKRALTWSRGLRARFGLDAEQSDEEIAEQVVGSVEDTGFTIADWSPVRRNARLGADLLGVVKNHGWAAGRAFCAEHGIELREEV